MAEYEEIAADMETWDNGRVARELAETMSQITLSPSVRALVNESIKRVFTPKKAVVVLGMNNGVMNAITSPNPDEVALIVESSGDGVETVRVYSVIGQHRDTEAELLSAANEGTKKAFEASNAPTVAVQSDIASTNN